MSDRLCRRFRGGGHKDIRGIIEFLGGMSA